MAGGQERVLRRRIKSVQSTKKITRAMELIAASQISRAQARIAASIPYSQGLAEILREAVQEAGGFAGRLVGVPESPKKILIVAIVGDRGLAGGYNSGVLRTVERLVRQISDPTSYGVIGVGRKSGAYLRYREITISELFAGFSEKPTFDDARQIAEVITKSFLDEESDQVLLISTRFLSAGTQVVETRQILPLPESAESVVSGTGTAEAASSTTPTGGYTEFEPDDVHELLADLVPRYAESAIFRALLEAAASEHTSRQRAMAAATENAEDLITRLSREMNRARQDSITTEIMEIVGGAEALRQSDDEA